jgi:hypothetical protein
MPLQFRKGSFGVGGPTRVRPGGMKATPKSSVPAVLPLPSTIDYLVVGGGGSGGQSQLPTGSYTGRSGGGGGGAGGLQLASGISITSSTSYTITVGTGGAPDQSQDQSGNSGTDSSIRHPQWLSSHAVGFNGSTGLQVNSISALEFGTGAFTIEFWFQCTGQPGYGYTLLYKAGPTPWGIYWEFDCITLNTAGGSDSITSDHQLKLNEWYHVAIVRESTNTDETKIYLNGAGSNLYYGIGTIPGDFDDTQPVLIGSGGGNNDFIGNFSNLRIVKGVAVYTGNFVPPQRSLTATQSAGTNISAITGTQTSLLTFQNSTLVDNSTYNSTINTASGAATISSISIPFYLALGIGGSSPFTLPYYGGSGDGGAWNGYNGYYSYTIAAQTRQPYKGLGNVGGDGDGPLTSGRFPWDPAQGGGKEGAGGGGGGAGDVGGNATSTVGYNGGAGGIGFSSDITGSSVTYAGGGGGGGGMLGTAGAGGSSIGGAGGSYGVNSGAGSNGTPNTGSGGGGMAATDSEDTLYSAGSGAGGVVIIAYPSSYAPITTINGGLTYTVDTTTRSGYRVYKFTGGSDTISW